MKKLLFISLLIIGCNNNNNKWQGVGDFEITRQESFNYSEMLSGELDSTAKSELEKYKEHIKNKNKKSEKNSIKEELKKTTKRTIKKLKQLPSQSIKKMKNLYKIIFFNQEDS